jgi:dolichol kinase
MIDASPQTAAPADSRRRTASLVFRGALAFNTALTVFWLATFLSGGTYFFKGYRLDGDAVNRIVFGILFFYVIWGVIWWAIKGALLRWFVGFTREERRDAFSSRMDRPYDVAELVSRYSERRIRITDMIGRRGRFITLASAGLYYLYLQVAREQNANFATAFLQDNLVDAVVTGWIFLSVYYVNGLLGAFFYGSQSRVMDGVLARANCLLITTLWTAFKFVMVPIGVQLAAVFPKEEFAPVFVLIWGSYVATDASAEIFGSLFGKQRIRVWGIGDVNRKSVAGTVAGFLAALILCVWVVTAHGLGTPWLILSLVLATSNSLLELYSPRGTDDFTMATTNALICWAFGAWFR